MAANGRQAGFSGAACPRELRCIGGMTRGPRRAVSLDESGVSFGFGGADISVGRFETRGALGDVNLIQDLAVIQRVDCIYGRMSGCI